MPLPSATLGTILAPVPRRVASHRYQLARNKQIGQAEPGWIRRRPIIYLPLFVLIVLLLMAANYPFWHVAGVAAVYGMLLAYWTFVAVRGTVGSDKEGALTKTTLITTSAHAIAIGLTGGLASPLTPQLLVAAVSSVLLFGRGRAAKTTVGFTLGAVAVITCLPLSLIGPPIAWPFDAILGAASVCFSLLILLANVFLVTDIHQQVGDTLDLVREDMLQTATTRSRSLETIGAKVAHELKNPLAAIKGLVQLVARNPADERSRERIEVIASEVSRMETILRDYLTLSRPLDDLHTHEVDLGQLVQEVLHVLDGRAHAAEVELSCEGGARIVGDARRLKEALLNVVQNALEATPPGGSVRVRVEGTDGGARLVVEDSGCGLTPEELERVGTPFFSTKQGGTGLGVVLARAVFVQHGGEVGYESELGRGTIVTVTLPPAPPSAVTASREGVLHGPGTAH